MAISDYSTLKTAVANWLARADLTNNIPDFIQLGEKRIWRDLKHPAMIASDSDSLSSGSPYASGALALSSYPDLISVISLIVTYGGDEIALEPLPMSAMSDESRVTVPRGYVMDADYIYIIGGAGSESFKLKYWSSGLPVSDSNAGKIATWPDLYLYAALLESAPFLKEDGRIGTWAQGYQASVDAINRIGEEARFNNSPRIRPVHNAP